MLFINCAVGFVAGVCVYIFLRTIHLSNSDVPTPLLNGTEVGTSAGAAPQQLTAACPPEGDTDKRGDHNLLNLLNKEFINIGPLSA